MGACSGEPVDPIDRLDANVIVGSGMDASDAGSPDDTGDLPDATVEDTSAPDARPRDATAPDAEPFPDAMVDVCNLPSEATLTATEALAQRAVLADRIITIVATATQGAAVCTDRACPMDDPCCNACSAQIFLPGNLALEATECASALCSGTGCGLVCSPPTLGIRGEYRGRFSATATGGFELLNAGF